MELIKELTGLTEEKKKAFDKNDAIKYIQSLGIEVDPDSMQVEKNKMGQSIGFKIINMTPAEAFGQLDSVSWMDEEKDIPDKKDMKDDSWKLFAGQGLGDGEGVWYDKRSKMGKREVFLSNHGKYGMITLINYKEPQL